MPLSGTLSVPPPPDRLVGTPVSPKAAAEIHASLSSPQPDIDPGLRPLPNAQPDLDTAIKTSDADRLLGELARLRRLHGNRIIFTDAVNQAIQQAKLQMLRLLIDNGVPVDDNNLELAAQCGYIPILKYLMQHMDWQIDRLSCYGRTVLILAIEHHDAVVWLLQQGANANQEDARGETPLSHAVEKGPLSVVTLLLKAGAAVTQGTPLRAALLRNAGEETIELMKEMLTRGAPVDKFIGENSPFVQSIGFERRTALHIACGRSYRNDKAAKLLLSYGADSTINQRLLEGEEVPKTSALEEARKWGNQEIERLILNPARGVDDTSKSSL